MAFALDLKDFPALGSSAGGPVLLGRWAESASSKVDPPAQPLLQPDLTWRQKNWSRRSTGTKVERAFPRGQDYCWAWPNSGRKQRGTWEWTSPKPKMVWRVKAAAST
mmetsp:Transcript_95159/g.226531  ORF Transcript_95159/g.226531 Transcript_95159/m.226531 type:complete len:107 (-) Transcript_95159:104-424(-)